jgi:hypothetical protein
MTEPEDFYRDFLPRFIEAQRAFHDVTPSPTSCCGPPHPR